MALDRESVGSWFRFITPVLVTLGLAVLLHLSGQLGQLNQLVYHHQTNAELHVTRAEFVGLQGQLLEMRREIIATIREDRRGSP